MQRKSVAGVLLTMALAMGLTAGCGLSGKENAGGDEESTPADGDDDVAEREVSEVFWPVAPSSWIADAAREPLRVHLTYEFDPATSITIQWQTDNVEVEGYTPKVWFAPVSEARGEGDNLELPFATQYTEEGRGFNYEETITLLAKEGFHAADDEKFVQFEVAVRGLEPDTEYYYRAGAWKDFDSETRQFTEATLSPIYKIKTGLPKGSTKKFSFMLCGDSRGGRALEGIRANVGRLDGMDAAFWLFNGDFNSTGKQEEWYNWFDAMAPVLNDTPFMPVQGNHEMFANVFYDQFALPKAPDLEDRWKENAYSFDYGNVHFIGLNSNTESVAAELKDWLDNDLARAKQDPEIAWTVAMFHFPAYSASTKHGSTTWVQKLYVPVFEKHGLDLAYSGHDHDYERTYPIKANAKVTDGQGVVYVVAGGFYSDGYSNGNDWFTAKSAHGDASNYVMVEVEGDTLKGTAYFGDGSVIENWTLTK
ncbi:MAG: metallophosphoesterase family protein [Myxococcales bacterium]|nr:MAG: metallophosphoesterase family protein [Myxococcales bacterium]